MAFGVDSPLMVGGFVSPDGRGGEGRIVYRVSALRTAAGYGKTMERRVTHRIGIHSNQIMI